MAQNSLKAVVEDIFKQVGNKDWRSLRLKDIRSKAEATLCVSLESRLGELTDIIKPMVDALDAKYPRDKDACSKELTDIQKTGGPREVTGSRTMGSESFWKVLKPRGPCMAQKLSERF
jgi:hypothetical protein